MHLCDRTEPYLGLYSNHEFLIVHLSPHSRNVLGPSNTKVSKLSTVCFCITMHSKMYTLKSMTHVKCTVKDWSCVLVLHPNGVCHYIVETDSGVPG